MQSRSVLVVLAALLAAASATYVCPVTDSCPGAIVPLPVSPNEIVDIFWMQAPLMAGTYGNELGNFHLFHNGLGFRMRSSGLNFTYQYVAGHGFMNALTPHVNTTLNTVDWCNQGAVCFNSGIDMTYWSPSAYATSTITPVGQISGAGYNNFISQFLPKIVANPPYYNLYQVESILGSMYIPSIACQDVARSALMSLYSYGAVLSCANIPTLIVPTLISFAQPKVVDPVANAAAIAAFYEDFPISGESTLQEVESIMQLIFTPNKYVIYQQQYYEITMPLLFATKYGFSFNGCQ